MNNDIDIFISHSSSDAEIARLLIEIVRKAFNIPKWKNSDVPVFQDITKAGATTDDEIKKEISYLKHSLDF